MNTSCVRNSELLNVKASDMNSFHGVLNSQVESKALSLVCQHIKQVELQLKTIEE